MKDNALYLEVDEDITSAIDKLAKIPGASVQIVVPKRSTMLQSMINLKLLKKAAESHGKQLVLVTNDRIATDLAARVGLGVAASIGARPVLTEADEPADLKGGEEVIDASDPEPQADPELAPDATTQSPAGDTPKPKSRLSMKRRKLSDDPPPPPPSAAADAAAADAAPKAAKKPLKVPNWNRLERRALWIGALVICVVAYFVLMYFFTGASVAIYANSTQNSFAADLTVDPSASQSDPASSQLAGKTITVTKNLSGTFSPTGKQTIGTKATGSITIYNCLDGNTHDVPAGTQFTDPNGNVFVSTADVSVPGGQGSFAGCSTAGTATVNVQASQDGSQYNEGPNTYSISSFPSGDQQGQDAITAKGSSMAGGSSSVVTVVSQNDVQNEQHSLVNQDKSSEGSQLSAQLPSGYTALTSSQNSSVSNVTPSPAVGAQATSATLSLKVTYTELAVQQSDLKSWLDAQELSAVGSGNEIYQDGLSSAQFTQTASQGSAQTFHVTANDFSGPKFDSAQIASKLAGLKYGDASDYLKNLPDVSDATVNIWPEWASNMPSQAAKIRITVKVANTGP